MSYELLPIEITQNGGHHYRQIWRDDHAAVYEQRNAFGAFLGYEAIAIKRQEACLAFGRQYQAKELYPCAEDWGKLAVSLSDLDRAMDAAREFSSRAARRQSTHLKGPDSSRIAQGSADVLKPLLRHGRIKDSVKKHSPEHALRKLRQSEGRASTPG